MRIPAGRIGVSAGGARVALGAFERVEGVDYAGHLDGEHHAVTGPGSSPSGSGVVLAGPWYVCAVGLGCSASRSVDRTEDAITVLLHAVRSG